MEGSSFSDRAIAARREFAEHSATIGISEEYIDRLVESFYDRIRADAVLGPIFETAIQDRWSVHLAKMKDFWSAIAFVNGRYSGKPMQGHAKLLPNLQPGHFDIWLRLFRETVEETAPTAEAAAFFIGRSERIAESLKLGLFYRPDQAAPQS
jgi:hemoglobin